MYKRGEWDKSLFFKELHAHKPHTRVSRGRPMGSQPPHRRYDSNNMIQNGGSPGNLNASTRFLSANEANGSGTNIASTRFLSENEANGSGTNNASTRFLSENRANGSGTHNTVFTPNNLNNNNNSNDGNQFFQSTQVDQSSFDAPLSNTAPHSDLSRYVPSPTTSSGTDGTNLSSAPRGVNNNPAWMTRRDQYRGGSVENVASLAPQGNSAAGISRDSLAKKRRIWVTRGNVLSTAPATALRQIPLAVDNKLPAIELRFGTNDDNEIQFLCHLDSCAGMNTGNLPLHQWLITKHPEIVKEYEECNNANPFHPSSEAGLCSSYCCR